MSFVKSPKRSHALKFARRLADKNSGAPFVTELGDAVWDLPPLILHPFNEHIAPSTLLENSRAALLLSGLAASDGTDPEILSERLLAARYTEVRMLFFLGKDILRWMEQCQEAIQRISALREALVTARSFAALLTAGAPANVRDKLTSWGVVDHAPIFTRSLGLNALFVRPPELDQLSPEFLNNYHRYADHLFRCYLEFQPHCIITAANFRFDLYASGEYSRLLESQWDGA